MLLNKLIPFPQISLLLCLFTAPTTAQIVPDNTLPRNSTVNIQGNVIEINDGTRTGNNLFHSFERFSVPTDNTAFFNNAADIQNIFSRVTGTSISEINGMIRANGVANLFLLNPNGIIFGENASLDIGGSFFATSADRIVFTNGSEFSATNPNTPPLLTINIPLGLGFRDNPGSVVNRSFASVVEVDETGEEFERFVGLQVPLGQTLALVGGEVSLEGGILTAEGGRVELGSVAGNNFIVLQPVAEGFALDYSGVLNFQDIRLSEFALVDTSGEGGGEIQVQGRQVSLTGDSAILSSTFGTEAGGDIIVVASESVEMIGGDTTIATGTAGTGAGGDITIQTRRLSLSEGAFIETPTRSEGNAGNLTVRASESVELKDTVEFEEIIVDEATGEEEVIVTELQGGLFAEVGSIDSSFDENQKASGQGGTIIIETGQLLIQDGAAISVDTFGLGQAGNLIVKASESVELIGSTPDNPSALFAGVNETAIGNGGAITVETGRLVITGGAEISTNTLSSGRAGDLTVKASESVELIGTTPDGQFASGLFALVDPEVTGDGGTLTVETPRLTVLGGAQIATSTAGSEGRGGDLTINAESILLSGASPLGDVRSSSGIFVTAEPFLEDESGNQITTGADAGQLTINATELIVENAAKVSAENFGTGLGGNATLNVDRLIVRSGGLVSAGSLIEDGVESNVRGPGGTLTINASESVEVTGTGLLGETPVRSRLVAESQGTGDAGNLNIFTPNLRVTDNAEVTVSATGDGEAGNLIINASDIRLENGRFSAETQLGTEGNIEIDASDIRLRRGSAITTNSLNTGTGGNIEINTDLLTAIENSDISANALAGSGGQVRISADSIFATQFRPQQTNASDITATSELGPEFSGTVELDSEIDPAQGLVELPQTVVDPAALIAQDPCKLGQNSEFIITGRGGLARTPNDRFDGNNVQVNLVDPVTTPRRSATVRRNTSTSATQPRSSLDIIPARGWIRNENGDVILVSYDPTQTGVRRQAPPSPQCQP